MAHTKLLIIASIIAISHAKDLLIGRSDEGLSVYDQELTSGPALWRRCDNITVTVHPDLVISAINVTDLRPLKDGEVRIVEGGIGANEVVIELKSPTIFRGYYFCVEVIAVPKSDHDFDVRTVTDIAKLGTGVVSIGKAKEDEPIPPTVNNEVSDSSNMSTSSTTSTPTAKSSMTTSSTTTTPTTTSTTTTTTTEITPTPVQLGTNLNLATRAVSTSTSSAASDAAVTLSHSNIETSTLQIPRDAKVNIDAKVEQADLAVLPPDALRISNVASNENASSSSVTQNGPSTEVTTLIPARLDNDMMQQNAAPIAGMVPPIPYNQPAQVANPDDGSDIKVTCIKDCLKWK